MSTHVLIIIRNIDLLVPLYDGFVECTADEQLAIQWNPDHHSVVVVSLVTPRYSHVKQSLLSLVTQEHVNVVTQLIVPENVYLNAVLFLEYYRDLSGEIQWTYVIPMRHSVMVGALPALSMMVLTLTSTM